jgi:hypothetical protein
MNVGVGILKFRSILCDLRQFSTYFQFHNCSMGQAEACVETESYTFLNFYIQKILFKLNYSLLPRNTTY